MDPHEWLEVVSRDYLADFVRDGGAAVKFAVPASDAGRQSLKAGLRTAAERHDFQFAFVDSAATKIHLIEQLFHAVARQVDWTTLARSYLRRSLQDMGFTLPPDGPQVGDGLPGAPGSLRLATLAALNDFPEPLFLTEVSRRLGRLLLGDYGMTREFRLAMLRLCLAQLEPGEDPLLTEAIEHWLRGELRLVSGVKQALIFQKVARHNARHMLFSLAHWLKAAGRSGLVLGLDIARYTDAARPSERGGGLYYSTAALLDAYEVLRQLIDATDELTYCFVGVLAAPEFLSDDRRGLRRYHALYLRVSDEVRDQYRPNPFAALVRVQGE